MKAWLDGGCFHAAGKCLIGSAHPDDAAELLHLATYLIFADEIVLGRYRGGEYLRMTEEAITRMEAIGLDRQLFRISETTRPELDSILDAAADNLARQLGMVSQYCFGEDPYRGYPARWLQLEQEFDRLVRLNLTDKQRSQHRERFEEEDNGGLLQTILAHEVLWSSVRDLVGDGSRWSASDSARLATLFRINVHQHHAEWAGALYTPNQRRSEPMRRTSDYILRRVTDLLGKAPSEQLADDTALPGVVSYLAQQAKGDPAGALQTAAALREKAAPLRKHLSTMIELTGANDTASMQRARREMQDLAKDLETAMSSCNVRRAAGCINLQNLICLLVMPGQILGVVDARKICSALRAGLWAGKRVAVLSEMAAGVEVMGHQPADYRALQHSVCRKANPGTSQA